MVGLYDFLRNFDVIETTTTIKGKLYTDAIAYMQQELEHDQKQRELKNKEKDANDAAPVSQEKKDQWRKHS